jgi:GNAT superfamily N-acetyltransferase
VSAAARAIDDASLLAREAAGLRAFYRPIAGCSPGGRLLELEGGVQAAIVPAQPHRSIINAVVYDDPQRAASALPQLARAYDDAGVRAWTVWVRPGHAALARALQSAGHRLDGRAAAMGAALDDLDLTAGVELALAPDPDWATVARINDGAYGLGAADGFVSALEHVEDPEAGLYVALVRGEPAAAVVARRRDGDCGMCLVATLPPARGRGLARELMRLALRDAQRAGCTTTTLEASAMGQPVYEALGYRALGWLEMWERRGAVPSAAGATEARPI